MYNPLTPLVDQLNWNLIMALPRNTKGLRSVVSNLFEGSTTLVGIFDLDLRYAVTGYVYQLANGDVAVVSDHFGLTDSRDAFEAADDDAVRDVVTCLCDNAKVFGDIKDAFLYLRQAKQDNATYHELKDVLDPVIKELYRTRAVNLEEILSN